MQFQRTIFESDTTKLMVNFTGISDDIANADNLRLHVYAFDKTNYKQIFEEILDISQIRKLFEHLNSISLIKDESKTISEKFIETNEEVLQLLGSIEKIDSKILKTILEKLDDKDKVKYLFEILSGAEIEDLSAVHIQQIHKQELANLEKLLELEEQGNIVEEIKKINFLARYVAGQPEKIFQKWIENNLWVFGVEYTQHHDAKRIALFSEGDLLMESMDGFLDLIELKRPNPEFSIFNHDSSHNSYYPSSELSKVIGQCLFYLQKLDEYKLNLEKEYKIKVLRPRIKIILGRTKDFNEEQMEALRMLNSNLNHIEIISYDHLINNCRKVIQTYDKRIS